MQQSNLRSDKIIGKERIRVWCKRPTLEQSGLGWVDPKPDEFDE